MRLATAFDEIAPLKDPRVQANPGYLVLILLSRVVTRLGSLNDLTPRLVEGLFAADLAYLQDLYNRLNDPGGGRLLVACPHCGGGCAGGAGSSGEWGASPRRRVMRGARTWALGGTGPTATRRAWEAPSDCAGGRR